MRRADEVALAFVAVAVATMFFGLPVLLVVGWAVEPLVLVGCLAVLPLSTVVGVRFAPYLLEDRFRLEDDARPHTQAAVGALCVGCGVLGLGWLPHTSTWWAVGPPFIAGLGFGIVLAVLAGGLMPERTAAEAARFFGVRYLGIGLVLVGLPLVIAGFEVVSERAREQAVARVFEAKVPSQDKLTLAFDVLGGLEAERPRAGLRAAFAEHDEDYAGEERVAYDELGRDADAVVVTAAGDTFRPAFLVAGVLAVLAALILRVGASRVDGRGRLRRWWVRALALDGFCEVTAFAFTYILFHIVLTPTPIAVAKLCEARAGLPGYIGFRPEPGLEALDTAACRLQISREELVLRLASVCRSDSSELHSPRCRASTRELP